MYVSMYLCAYAGKCVYTQRERHAYILHKGVQSLHIVFKIRLFESSHLCLWWKLWIDLFYNPFNCFLWYSWCSQEPSSISQFKSSSNLSSLLLQSPDLFSYSGTIDGQTNGAKRSPLLSNVHWITKKSTGEIIFDIVHITILYISQYIQI